MKTKKRNDVWMWQNRKYERITDRTCPSGRRMYEGPRNGQCMPKRKCKVRWSPFRGRCKKTAKVHRLTNG